MPKHVAVDCSDGSQGFLGLIGRPKIDLQSSRLGDANYDEIGDYQNPKGVRADYWDFDEYPHDRNKKQHKGCENSPLERLLGRGVNTMPNNDPPPDSATRHLPIRPVPRWRRRAGRF
jgi:hypothetical protein